MKQHQEHVPLRSLTRDILLDEQPDLDPASATWSSAFDSRYRSILRAFKRILETMGVDPDRFRSGRNFAIPVTRQELWKVALSNVQAFTSEHPTSKRVTDLLDSLRSALDALEDKLEDGRVPFEDADVFRANLVSLQRLSESPELERARLANMKRRVIRRVEREIEHLEDHYPDIDDLEPIVERYERTIESALKECRESLERNSAENDAFGQLLRSRPYDTQTYESSLETIHGHESSPDLTAMLLIICRLVTAKGAT